MRESKRDDCEYQGSLVSIGKSGQAWEKAGVQADGNFEDLVQISLRARHCTTNTFFAVEFESAIDRHGLESMAATEKKLP